MEPHVYSEMASLQETHWWYTGRRFVLRSILDRFLKNKNGMILEVGCGPGGNFRLLSSYGTLTALEPNENAFEFLKQHNNIKVIKGGLPADESVEKQSYDLVAGLDVLEHIPDEQAGLDGFCDLVKSGGQLLLTVPAYQFMWSSHDESHHHFRRYTKSHLVGLLRDKGWSIDYSSYFNSLLFPIPLLLRMIDKVKKGVGSTGGGEMPALLNIPLKLIFSFEGILLRFLRFPFGLSIIVIAGKP